VSASRVDGSVAILIPTREVIRQYGVEKGAQAGAEQIEYVVDVVELGFVGRAHSVAAGQVFDKVTVLRTPDAEHYSAAGSDYKLWLFAESLGSWQWYLSKAGVTAREPVTVDMGLPRSQRESSFNESLVKAAKALGGATFSRATGTPPANNDVPKDNLPKASGTGFFVNDGGMALTNAHVIRDCSAIRAVLRDGKSVSATVMGVDRENDLALLRTETRSKAFGQFRISSPVRQGEQIVIYGFPLAGALASTGNLATGIVSALAGLGDDTSKLQISAPIQPGNSGGPVLDQSGHVIGVVVSKLNAIKAASITGDIPQNVNFAIKTGVVTAFLEANGADFTAATARKTLTTEDLGDQAKTFTFMIECR